MFVLTRARRQLRSEHNLLCAVWRNFTGNLYAQTTSGTNVAIPITGTTGAQSNLVFVPIMPCRAADTRHPDGEFGGPILAAGASRTFDLQGSSCGIPVNAAAFSLNVTIVPEHGLGFLTVWPAGSTRPPTSTLNSDSRVKANAAIIAAGANNSISVYASDNTHFILDINGYFAPPPQTGLVFYPVTPCRIADTRKPTGTFGGPSLSAAASRDFPISAGSCNVPSSAQAYSLNLTAVPPGGIGFLTAWPAGTTRPLASTLNANAHAVTANAAIVQAGANGSVSIYSSDQTDLVIDINGYFAPPAADGLYFYNSLPCRVYDTGAAIQINGGSINPETVCGLPSTRVYTLNATVVPAAGLGFLTLWPAGESRPLVSTLNSDGSVASNLAIVSGTSGVVDAYASDFTRLIIDVGGYLAP